MNITTAIVLAVLGACAGALQGTWLAFRTHRRREEQRARAAEQLHEW